MIAGATTNALREEGLAEEPRGVKMAGAVESRRRCGVEKLADYSIVVPVVSVNRNAPWTFVGLLRVCSLHPDWRVHLISLMQSRVTSSGRGKRSPLDEQNCSGNCCGFSHRHSALAKADCPKYTNPKLDEENCELQNGVGLYRFHRRIHVSHIVTFTDPELV